MAHLLKLQDAQFREFEDIATKRVSVKDLYPTVYNSWPEERKKLHDAGFGFLHNNLAKVEKTVYKPFYNVTYHRDVKSIEVGSELIDAIEFYTLDYTGIEDEINNIFGTRGDVIPTVTGGLTQGKLEVYNFEVMHAIKFVEMEKLAKKQLPVSIEEVFKDIVIIGFDLFVNRVFYLGVGNTGGLFNHSGVKVNSIPTITTSNITNEATVTNTMIIALFNGIIKQYLDNTNGNLKVIPNRFLVPNFVGRVLTDRASALLADNLRNYILKHNLATDESIAAGMSDFKISIESRPMLDTLGLAGKGRIVAYNDDPMFIKFHIPYGLKSYMTLPNINKAQYETLWLAQVAQLQLPYNKDNTVLGAVAYWDFTA